MLIAMVFSWLRLEALVKKLKNFIVEVSFENKIEEFDVIAESAIDARGVIIRYFASVPPGMRFRARSAPGAADGEPRVVRRKS